MFDNISVLINAHAQINVRAYTHTHTQHTHTKTYTHKSTCVHTRTHTHNTRTHKKYIRTYLHTWKECKLTYLYIHIWTHIQTYVHRKWKSFISTTCERILTRTRARWRCYSKRFEIAFPISGFAENSFFSHTFNHHLAHWLYLLVILTDFLVINRDDQWRVPEMSGWST